MNDLQLALYHTLTVWYRVAPTERARFAVLTIMLVLAGGDA